MTQTIVKAVQREGLTSSEKALIGTPLSCDVNNTVLSALTGEIYTAPGSNATPLSAVTENSLGWVATRDGLLRNFFIRSGNIAKVNSPVTIFTVRKNGTDTGLTVTITQTINTNSSDTAHTVNLSQGDVITIKGVTTGTLAVSVSLASISIQFD